MASVCTKTRNCAEKRRSGGPPGSRVMAEAIALYFSYAESQYAKRNPLFVCPGPDAFFAHVARLECLNRTQGAQRRSLRFAAAAAETTIEFLDFLDFLVPPPKSNRTLQAVLIAERALAGYVYLIGKDDSEDWPRSHLIQPLGWFLKLLFPATHEKIAGAELKHVAELIVGIADTPTKPKKIFTAIESIQASQTFVLAAQA